MTDPDAFHAALVAAHEGLSEAQSQAFVLRLLLLLASRLDDATVLAAIKDAR